MTPLLHMIEAALGKQSMSLVEKKSSVPTNPHSAAFVEGIKSGVLMSLTAPSVIIVKSIEAAADLILDKTQKAKQPLPSLVPYKMSLMLGKGIGGSQYQIEDRRRYRPRRCTNCGERHPSFKQCQESPSKLPRQFFHKSLFVNKLTSNMSGLR